LETLRNFLNRLIPKGSAMRHVSILAGGTTIAQGLNVAIMPILSRIYSPADFGVMAVFVSITAILSTFSGLRYQLSIPLPKQDHYAEAAMFLSLGLQAFCLVIISILIISFGQAFIGSALDEVRPFRFFIPVAVAGIGVYSTFNQIAIRKKGFRTIAKTKVTQSISANLTKLVLGFLGFRPLGLLIGYILGQIGGISTLARSLFIKNGFPKLQLKKVKRVAIRYKNFPLFETWSAMLNVVGSMIMPILLAVFFDSKTAGLFAMSQNLLFLPSALVGQAIGQVFLQRASVAKYRGNLKQLAIASYSIMVNLGFFPILMVSFFAPSFFPFFLGENWIESGAFARVLGPWVAIGFAASPMDNLFLILDKQQKLFYIEVIQTVTRVVAIVLASLHESTIFAVLFFSAIGFSIYILKIFIVLGKSGSSIKEILEGPISGLVLGVLLVSPSIIAEIFEIAMIYKVFLVVFAIIGYLIVIKNKVVSKYQMLGN